MKEIDLIYNDEDPDESNGGEEEESLLDLDPGASVFSDDDEADLSEVQRQDLGIGDFDPSGNEEDKS